jgi:hypothetical protein
MDWILSARDPWDREFESQAVEPPGPTAAGTGRNGNVRGLGRRGGWWLTVRIGVERTVTVFHDWGIQRIDDTSPNSRHSLRHDSPPSSLR